MVIGAREDQTGTMGQHVAEVAPAQAMCTSAMMETRIIVKRRTAWVLSPSADSIKLQSGPEGLTGADQRATAMFQGAVLGNTDRLGPARTAAQAGTKTKISSQDHHAQDVGLASTRMVMELQGVNNAQLVGPRPVLANRLVVNVSFAMFFLD